MFALIDFNCFKRNHVISGWIWNVVFFCFAWENKHVFVLPSLKCRYWSIEHTIQMEWQLTKLLANKQIVLFNLIFFSTSIASLSAWNLQSIDLAHANPLYAEVLNAQPSFTLMKPGNRKVHRKEIVKRFETSVHQKWLRWTMLTQKR